MKRRLVRFKPKEQGRNLYSSVSFRTEEEGDVYFTQALQRALCKEFVVGKKKEEEKVRG